MRAVAAGVLVDAVAAHLTRLVDARGRVLAAVDGPDAAGKTTFAASVAERLGDRVVRVSADDHHRPRSERTAAEGDAASSYFRGAFDVATIDSLLLDFAAGAPRVLVASFDLASDRPAPRWATCPTQCVLLVEGVFLQRAELRRHWDHVTYLQVSEQVTLDRARRRDAALLGGEDAVLSRYRSRYLPGQRLYRDVAWPESGADLLVDNDDPARPVVVVDRAELLGPDAPP